MYNLYKSVKSIKFMAETKSAEKSVLVETFGENPLVKTIDFFLMHPNFDYSKSQVAKETGISRITMEKIWKRLLKKSIIVKTREMGRGELYKLNTQNPQVKVLMKLDFEMSSAAFDQEKISVTHSRK